MEKDKAEFPKAEFKFDFGNLSEKEQKEKIEEIIKDRNKILISMGYTIDQAGNIIPPKTINEGNIDLYNNENEEEIYNPDYSIYQDENQFEKELSEEEKKKLMNNVSETIEKDGFVIRTIFFDDKYFFCDKSHAKYVRIETYKDGKCIDKKSLPYNQEDENISSSFGYRM